MRTRPGVLGLVALLPALLAADPITLKATPNANGKAMTLVGEGSFTDASVAGVIFIAETSVAQRTRIVATLDPTKDPFAWRAELKLAPGTYECWAVLVLYDDAADSAPTHVSERKTVTVK